MRRIFWASLVVVSAVSATAGAEEVGGHIITLKRVIITAPRQRPLAAVDVAPDPLRFPPPPLRQAFLDRVEAAVEKEPF